MQVDAIYCLFAICFVFHALQKRSRDRRRQRLEEAMDLYLRAHYHLPTLQLYQCSVVLSFCEKPQKRSRASSHHHSPLMGRL